MLIDTSATIAYKCTSCGSFEFFSVSLFILLYKKKCSLPCRCKKSSITVKQEGENNFLISIPCIGCGNEHTYLLTKKSFLSGDPAVLNCPETGMQICFVGRDETVRKKVDSLEEEMDELMDAYGYESYFKNTRVMFDILNRIHDIALNDNLYCECGGSDIELVLLSDCILLRCAKCGCDRRIAAANNKDLKSILMKNQILLSENMIQCEAENGDNIISGPTVEKCGK